MRSPLRLLAQDSAMLARWLDGWAGEVPGAGLFALVAERDRALVPMIQAECRARGVTLVGAVFPGLLSESEISSEGAWLLPTLRSSPHVLLGDLPDDAEAAGRTVAMAAAALRLPEPMEDASARPTLLLLFDAMVPNLSSLLAAIHGELRGRVRYAGVSVGSETFQPMPCLFDAERLVGHGVAVLLVPGAVQAALAHGYPTTRSLGRATGTDSNRIDHIDGRPAFEAYRDMVRAEAGVELTAENLYTEGVHHPFGLVTAVDVLVRIPVALQADGSLSFIGEVPPNSALRVLRAPKPGEPHTVETLARAFGDARRGDPLMTFYCAGRRAHFGAAAVDEVRMLSERLSRPVLGALSLGEVDTHPELGHPRFHNAGVLCVG